MFKLCETMSMKKILILSLIFLTGCSVSTETDKSPQECTLEAKVCPDGSTVGRSGPNCKFAPCPQIHTIPTQTIRTTDITDAHPAYKFDSIIPQSWEVEAVPEINALNFYNPGAEGVNNLEKSQIFVRYFEASTFLTLQTVTIHSQNNTTLNNRPAVVYDIEKKNSVAPFPNQPKWRNKRHIVTDIRSTDTSPATFYVFAKLPVLEQKIFNQFIENLNF